MTETEEVFEVFVDRVAEAANSVARQLDNPMYTEILEQALEVLLPVVFGFAEIHEPIRTVVVAEPLGAKDTSGVLLVTTERLVHAWFDFDRSGPQQGNLSSLKIDEITSIDYQLVKLGFFAGWRTHLRIAGADESWALELLDQKSGIVQSAVKSAIVGGGF